MHTHGITSSTFITPFGVGTPVFAVQYSSNVLDRNRKI
jgi:hypothetical protein